MITLKMEKRPNGYAKPLELDVNGIVYKYEHHDNKPKEEFFKKLNDYLNYKIRVVYVDPDGEKLKEKNYTIKSVERNNNGVMTLELD